MLRLAAAFFACLLPVAAQRDLSGIGELRKSLDRVASVGSVLIIAAHPDDENTALIAYFARGRNLRTGYLSLTRGEGGQNLIGAEQGDKIGVIRTQELLAARRIDGGEQFFGRMVDFGFSKTAEETIRKWGHENILDDTVWTIRRFRPDVIILRFSGTPRDGHGHHQTSALLGKEAFEAAADPAKFPDQLKFVEPWQARRLYFNLFNWRPGMDEENEKIPGTLVLDPGQYDPILGYAYTEIAGMSRSQHRSQGMGAPERKGTSRDYLLPLAGDKAERDPFDGIDTTWSRLGLPKVDEILGRARRELRDDDPAAIVPILFEARALIAGSKNAMAQRKLRELDETIALASGIWVDVSAERSETVPGSMVHVSTNAIVRSRLPVSLNGKALPANRMESIVEEWALPADQPLSQPYWLREPKDGTIYRIPDQTLLGRPENPPEIRTAKLTISGKEIELARPVHNRYVDRADGELVRPFVVVPPVAVQPGGRVVLFPSRAPKPVEITVTAKVPKAKGTVRLELPRGWSAQPESHPFQLENTGEQTTVQFLVKPSAESKRGELRAIAEMNGRSYDRGIDVIRYPHFPAQTLFPPSTADLVPVDVKNLSKRVGYVTGAGDDVPASLEELGCEVTFLSPYDLARTNLSRFDSIVMGVRAYNTRPELRANHHRLMEFVSNGGTIIVQYNVAENRFRGGTPTMDARIGPYPMKVGPGRVTDEAAAVELIHSSERILQSPNAIGAADWDGWVQERGLYFASEWDPKYRTILRMKDPGEQPQDGSTLIARYGKGVWIYTSLAFFRQLPAGVPGAYRLFANFLSAGKAEAGTASGR